MRIQHNIMAMNAYRNYNNNTSALSKNLEKLSSGYKINRAGDDAAGLAISEKMRAQITGLEAAQKNVKDGISLVKTAEGAMQEIQDMLNRMDYLATQSANGTYQDEVDREALQQEVDSLREEINRIADSANFNGIKLLDGSLDASDKVTTIEGSFQFAANHDGTVADGAITLPPVGDTLGTNSVLHKDASDPNAKNEFSVELHNLETTNATGSAVTIQIGNDKFTLKAADTGSAGTKMTAEDIAAAFKAGKFVVGDETSTTAMTANKATIDGTEYDVTVDGGKITFSTTTDLAAGKTIPKEVTVTGVGGAAQAAVPGNKAKAVASVTFEDDNGPATPAANDTITFTGTGLNMTFKLGADGNWTSTDAAPTGYTATFDGTDLTIEGAANADVADDPFGTITAAVTIAGNTDNPKATMGTTTWTPGKADVAAVPAGSNPLTGDYNKSTTDISNKGAVNSERLASTKFDLAALAGADGKIAEGTTLTIGKDTYTFTNDASKAGKEGYVVMEENDTIAKIAEKLTDAAAANTTYTVGFDNGTNKVTVTEVKGQKNFDLTTMSGIEKSLGFSKSTTEAGTGVAMNLQIGDSSDSYNQMKVSVGDMHTDAMGSKNGTTIADINIGTSEGAQAAVNVIKDAINYVSSVRGQLGAYQNRLEHTQNNLSVMAENIQDAESTIRDTDVAEEMMSYVKNNILVQSAQAMLAQANQVPQGVLQLLG